MMVFRQSATQEKTKTLSRPGFISWFGQKLGISDDYNRINQFLDSNF